MKTCPATLPCLLTAAPPPVPCSAGPTPSASCRQVARGCPVSAAPAQESRHGLAGTPAAPLRRHECHGLPSPAPGGRSSYLPAPSQISHAHRPRTGPDRSGLDHPGVSTALPPQPQAHPTMSRAAPRCRGSAGPNTSSTVIARCLACSPALGRRSPPVSLTVTVAVRRRARS